MYEAHPRRWPVWAFTLLLLGATAAPATVFIDLSLEQLTRSATFVVHGMVSEVEATEDEKTGAISTLVRLRVEEALKGTGFGEVEVEVEGGRVGDRSMVIAGSPRFEIGEEVLLFLMRAPGGRYHVVEMSQGKYGVERDAEGKAWVAGQLSMQPLFPEKSLELDESGRLPLERFMQDLRPLTKAQGGGQWVR